MKIVDKTVKIPGVMDAENIPRGQVFRATVGGTHGIYLRAFGSIVQLDFVEGVQPGVWYKRGREANLSSNSSLDRFPEVKDYEALNATLIIE